MTMSKTVVMNSISAVFTLGVLSVVILAAVLHLGLIPTPDPLAPDKDDPFTSTVSLVAHNASVTWRDVSVPKVVRERRNMVSIGDVQKLQFQTRNGCKMRILAEAHKIVINGEPLRELPQPQEPELIEVAKCR